MKNKEKRALRLDADAAADRAGAAHVRNVLEAVTDVVYRPPAPDTRADTKRKA